MSNGDVTRGACAELRRAAKRGAGLSELADAYRVDRAVVARHVRGRCDHDDGEPPAPME